MPIIFGTNNVNLGVAAVTCTLLEDHDSED